MLLGRTAVVLACDLFEGATYAETGVARLDYIVDITFGSCLVGVGKELVYSFSFCARKALGSASALAALALRMATAPLAPITAIFLQKAKRSSHRS